MSKLTIRSERLSASIRLHGAELCSLRDEASGREFLWQGDPSVWDGQSPLLFPVIGRVKGGKYLFGDRECEMPMHGFVRSMEFEAESFSDDRLCLLLRDTPETRRAYPFPFELRVELSFDGDTLIISHRVRNTGHEDMPFCIGAHPGFFCADGDRLLLDAPETLTLHQLDPTANLLSPAAAHYEVQDGIIPLQSGLFAHDALMFSGVKSRSMTLSRQDGSSVRVEYGEAPCVGVWSRNTESLHYVCIEPWYGMDDSTEATGIFTDKPWCQTVRPGEEFLFPVRITVKP